MRKIILLDEYFPTGEQSVQPAVLWHAGKPYTDAHGGITKHASEAIDYIKNVVPEPGKTIMLVLALGSEEAYGPNRNGDGFPERPVRAKKGNGYWVNPGEELTKHYQSFEKGHVFQHHVNKDPKKASGYVKKAFWNDKMHRVELLIVVDNNKDPEWVSRMNDGEFPSVSMGCKIRHDTCSLCGNNAPSRAQYCSHVNGQDHRLNDILPDGRRAYVHNPSPNFFDISRVFRPADKTGYTLKKVAYESPYELISGAELGEAAEMAEDKSAAIKKLSDIDKVIRGETAASSSLSNDETQVIRKFKDYAGPKLSPGGEVPIEELLKRRPADVLATLSNMGVVLTTRDMMSYLLKLLCPDKQIDPSVIDKAVAAQGKIFEMFSESPALLDEVLSTGMLNEGTPDSGLAEKLSNVTGMIFRKLVPDGIGLRNDESPTTDLMHSSDASGRELTTDRGAVIDAHDMNARDQLASMFGGAALLSAAYGVTAANPALKNWRLPLAAGTAAAGYGILKPKGFGQETPQNTEFAPTQERTAAFVLKLLRDYSGPHHANQLSGLNNIKEGSIIDAVVGPIVSMDVVATKIGKLLIA